MHPSVEWLAAALGASGFLLLAALAYPGGMGMGDVKLALLLGVVLGRTVPVALMIGMVSALVPAVVLLARHGTAARKMGIPFGPFLALGGVVALFAGQAIARRVPRAALMEPSMDIDDQPDLRLVGGRRGRNSGCPPTRGATEISSRT